LAVEGGQGSDDRKNGEVVSKNEMKKIRGWVYGSDDEVVLKDQGE